MSVIASDFIDLESFDQPLAAILKNASISTFVPKISINTSAKFGACITK